MSRFKNYRVTIFNPKTKDVTLEFEEPAKSQDYLKTKYKNKYEFSDPKLSVKVVRIVKKPGVQTDLLDLINECEKVA